MFRVNVAGRQQVTPQVTVQGVKVPKAARTPRTREELRAAAGIAHREPFWLSYLKPAAKVPADGGRRDTAIAKWSNEQ